MRFTPKTKWTINSPLLVLLLTLSSCAYPVPIEDAGYPKLDATNAEGNAYFKSREQPRGHWQYKLISMRVTETGEETGYLYYWVGSSNVSIWKMIFRNDKLISHELVPPADLGSRTNFRSQGQSLD